MTTTSPNEALAAAGIAPHRRGRERFRALTDDERGFYRWILRRFAAAYPFAGRETAHRVRFEGREVYAMCALDALGIAPMLGEPITIASRDPLTGEEIEVALEPEGGGSSRPEDTVVVSGTMGSADSCDACCPVLNFFASATNAERWLAAHP